MGWHLLRRKALTLLASGLIAAGAWGAESFPAVAMTPAPADPSAVMSAGEIADGQAREEAAAVPSDTGPLPPVQGHRGEELYTFAPHDEDLVQRYMTGLLTQRRDWLQAVLVRSLRYRAVIVPALESRGLPRELLFLPALESGFQSRATSPRGAGGLWQLMRGTASRLGLRMDQWLDERRDFWKATEASLDKLADNYRMFGDWCLALAAYNCGDARLSRILRSQPGADFWALRRKKALPRETAAFVPQFIALARILGYPGRYGLDMGWDPMTEWARVPLSGCVDLRILARESGLAYDTLAAGNAELNLPMTPPSSYGYELKVPVEYREAVERTLVAAAVPLLNFLVHVVEPGDTLSEIALKYGVTVEMILEFNPSVKPLALQIGARVLVPFPGARRAG
jgi:membrane-bound lytic murein transglycosylase D